MPQIPSVTARQLKSKLNQGERFVLLDVREPAEHAESRIEGAVLIPLGRLEQKYLALDPSKEIIVYCRSGGRSARATEFLIAKGYKAANLEGGILAWAGIA